MSRPSDSDGSLQLFVVGTLKAGFPLHERALSGVAKLRDGSTVQRFPLVIAGPWFAPMMFDEPGTGHRIHGELYAVDADRLAEIDMKSRTLAVPCHTGYLETYDDHRFVPFEHRPASERR